VDYLLITVPHIKIDSDYIKRSIFLRLNFIIDVLLLLCCWWFPHVFANELTDSNWVQKGFQPENDRTSNGILGGVKFIEWSWEDCLNVIIQEESNEDVVEAKNDECEEAHVGEDDENFISDEDASGDIEESTGQAGDSPGGQ